MKANRRIVDEDEVMRLLFDGVVVAIGNYHQPFLPVEIPGLREWSGAAPDGVIHAIDYRAADSFAKKVLNAFLIFIMVDC